MKISTEEKLMYTVMKAIYESGIPISFKGSMVLKACLIEAGYASDTRHTVDIDGNWNSDEQPSAEQMVESLQKAIDRIEYGLSVRLYRMYGEGRSAGFELMDRDSGDVLFTMDIDVNRPLMPTKLYVVEGIHFCGISPTQMLADKLSAVSTDKVFRRIKDVVDLYYISQVFDFNKTEIKEVLQTSGITLESFDAFLHRKDELEYSYEKFRFAGDINNPPFTDIYHTVKSYIKEILPHEKDLCDEKSKENPREQIVFDKAGPEDIDELIALRIAYITEDTGPEDEDRKERIRTQLAGYFSRRLSTELIAFTARDGGKIVSVAYLHIIEMPANAALPDGLRGEVLSVYTMPGYRGRGLCSRLMRDLIGYGRSAGLGRIDLSATEQGLPIYRKLGFAEKSGSYTEMRYTYQQNTSHQAG